MSAAAQQREWSVELVQSTKMVNKHEGKVLWGQCLKQNNSVAFTSRFLSDLAQHYLVKANITAIRRVRKTDNNRIARYAAANQRSAPQTGSFSEL